MVLINDITMIHEYILNDEPELANVIAESISKRGTQVLSVEHGTITVDADELTGIYILGIFASQEVNVTHVIKQNG